MFQLLVLVTLLLASALFASWPLARRAPLRYAVLATSLWLVPLAPLALHLAKRVALPQPLFAWRWLVQPESLDAAQEPPLAEGRVRQQTERRTAGDQPHAEPQDNPEDLTGSRWPEVSPVRPSGPWLGPGRAQADAQPIDLQRIDLELDSLAERVLAEGLGAPTGSGLSGQADADAGAGTPLARQRRFVLISGWTLPRGAWRARLITIWIVGILGAAYGLARAWCKARRWLRASRPAQQRRIAEACRRVEQRLGLGRPLDVRWSAAARVPLAVGLRRPVVLLPRSVGGRLADTELDAVLMHEAAHIQRGDLWRIPAQELVRAIFWFHPLVHLVMRGIRQAREEICDNYVIREIGGTEYCQVLLRVSTMAGRPHSLLASASLLGSRGSLERRVESILDERRKLMVRARPLASWITVLVMGAVFALSTVSVGQDTSGSDDVSPTATATSAADQDQGTTTKAQSPPAETSRAEASDSGIRALFANPGHDAPAAGSDESERGMVFGEGKGQAARQLQAANAAVLEQRLARLERMVEDLAKAVSASQAARSTANGNRPAGYGGAAGYGYGSYGPPAEGTDDDVNRTRRRGEETGQEQSGSGYGRGTYGSLGYGAGTAPSGNRYGGAAGGGYGSPSSAADTRGYGYGYQGGYGDTNPPGSGYGYGYGYAGGYGAAQAADGDPSSDDAHRFYVVDFDRRRSARAHLIGSSFGRSGSSRTRFLKVGGVGGARGAARRLLLNDRFEVVGVERSPEDVAKLTGEPAVQDGRTAWFEVVQN